MKREQFLPLSFQLVLTAVDLARMVQTMDEAPPGQVSKYSYYLFTAPGMEGPKVVRNAMRDWGPEQHESVLHAAWDHAISQRDVITAAIESYGDESKRRVRVVARYKDSGFAVEFPYVVREDGWEFVPPLDESKTSLVTGLEHWADKVIPKRFLGLF
jgi:hypothetical protein